MTIKIPFDIRSSTQTRRSNYGLFSSKMWDFFHKKVTFKGKKEFEGHAFTTHLLITFYNAQFVYHVFWCIFDYIFIRAVQIEKRWRALTAVIVRWLITYMKIPFDIQNSKQKCFNYGSFSKKVWNLFSQKSSVQNQKGIWRSRFHNSFPIHQGYFAQDSISCSV